MPFTIRIPGAAALAVLALLVSACNLPNQQAASTPVDVGAYSTSVAATVLVSFTQTVQAAATPIPQATATQAPPASTDAPALSETPSAQLTSTAAPTVTAGSCDNATWVADVSVPDGSPFAPGTEFVKTWRVRNTGGCTWTTDYKMIYGYGDRMGGVSVKLDKEVKSGEEAEISITLRSPANFGNYAGYWRLSNDKGYPFGQFFSVIISVPKP